ncbi:unnamed protein product [Bemisia tabaci]|uniref:C2H2-type domain-containing protein n=1 Tax=Bemisia tabaci TaxID=7038 RepID=A0A9P0C9Y7_BEMTA|nr:unnamed protein product [Bemisia tabaci]
MEVDTKMIRPFTTPRLNNYEVISRNRKLTCHICQKDLTYVASYYNHLSRHHTKADLSLCILELSKLLAPKASISTTSSGSLESDGGTFVCNNTPEVDDKIIIDSQTQPTELSSSDGKNDSESISSNLNLTSSSSCKVHHSSSQLNLLTENRIELEGSKKNSAQSSTSLKELSSIPKENGSEISATNSCEPKSANEEQISFCSNLGLGRLKVSDEPNSSTHQPADPGRKDGDSTKKDTYDSKLSTNFIVPDKFSAEEPVTKDDCIFEPMLSPLIEKLISSGPISAKDALPEVATELNLSNLLKTSAWAEAKARSPEGTTVPSSKRKFSDEGGSRLSTSVSKLYSRVFERIKKKPKSIPVKTKMTFKVSPRCDSTPNSVATSVSESSSGISSSLVEASNHNSVREQCGTLNLCSQPHASHRDLQTSEGAWINSLQSDHIYCNSRSGDDFEHCLSDSSGKGSKSRSGSDPQLPGAADDIEDNRLLSQVSTEVEVIRIGKNLSTQREESSKMASCCDGIQSVEYASEMPSPIEKIHKNQTLVKSPQGGDPINLTKAISNGSLSDSVSKTPQKDNALRVVNKYVRLNSKHELLRNLKTDPPSSTNKINEISPGDEAHEAAEIPSNNHDEIKAPDENKPCSDSQSSTTGISLLKTSEKCAEKFDVAEGAALKTNRELSIGKPSTTSRSPQFVDSNGVVWGIVEIDTGTYPLKVLKPIKIPDNGKTDSSAQENITTHKAGSMKRKSKTPRKNKPPLKPVALEQKMKMKNPAFRNDGNSCIEMESTRMDNNKLDEQLSDRSEISNQTSSVPFRNGDSHCKSNEPRSKIAFKGKSLIESSCTDLVPSSMITTEETDPVSDEETDNSRCTCLKSKGIERNSSIASVSDTKTCEMRKQCMNSNPEGPIGVRAISDTCHLSHQNSCCSANRSCVAPSEKYYMCSHCLKEFSRKSHLIRHHRSHFDERPFECDTCHKKFTTKAILKQHERLHSGERPFACSFCNKTFSQKSSLLTHTMLHSGKPFKCFFCRLAVVSNHKLQRHLRRHEISDSGLFCCACDSQFTVESTFREHLAKVHNYPPEFRIVKVGSILEEEKKRKRKINKKLLIT